GRSRSPRSTSGRRRRSPRTKEAARWRGPPRSGSVSRYVYGVLVAVVAVLTTVVVLVLVLVLVLVVIRAILVAAHEHAVHVDVVEDGEAEVVRPGVLTLVEHDLDALDLFALDVDWRSAELRGRDDRVAATTPAEAEPAVPDGRRRHGSRA